jgi:hypothetical protein
VAAGPRPIRIAIALAAFALAWPATACAETFALASNVEARGLIAGPFITGAGDVWESQSGVMLTNHTGVSSVLAPPDAPNWDNLVDLTWFGAGWWAQARPSGVFAGRIGGGLRELAPLGRCNPGSPQLPPAAAQYAITGEHLYALLPAACFSKASPDGGVVLDIDLHSHRTHVLAHVAGTLDYIAASGKYVAIAYTRRPAGAASGAAPNVRPQEPQLFVRVLDAATGELVNQVKPPHNLTFAQSNASGLQVDNHGDVLVGAGCCAASPGMLARVAQPAEITHWWWAKPRSSVGTEAELGRDAVLSDGRVAFLSHETGGAQDETIDVRDLLDGATSELVSFLGTASADGVALSGDTLVWAQQSTVLDVTSGPAAGGGSFTSCVPVELGPVELASVDLREIRSSPVLVTGAPIPPQYRNEPPCIEA